MTAVDLDDTLCCFLPQVRQLTSHKFGKKLDDSSLSTNWMVDQVTEEEWNIVRPLIYNLRFT